MADDDERRREREGNETYAEELSIEDSEDSRKTLIVPWCTREKMMWLA